MKRRNFFQRLGIASLFMISSKAFAGDDSEVHKNRIKIVLIDTQEITVVKTPPLNTVKSIKFSSGQIVRIYLYKDEETHHTKIRVRSANIRFYRSVDTNIHPAMLHNNGDIDEIIIYLTLDYV